MRCMPMHGHAPSLVGVAVRENRVEMGGPHVAVHLGTRVAVWVPEPSGEEVAHHVCGPRLVRRGRGVCAGNQADGTQPASAGLQDAVKIGVPGDVGIAPTTSAQWSRHVLRAARASAKSWLATTRSLLACMIWAAM